MLKILSQVCDVHDCKMYRSNMTDLVNLKCNYFSCYINLYNNTYSSNFHYFLITN